VRVSTRREESHQVVDLTWESVIGLPSYGLFLLAGFHVLSIRPSLATEEGAQVAAELIPPFEQKLSFPAGAVEQTAAVFAALNAANGPLDAAGLAAQFKRTKTTEKRVGDVLASLARLGYVTSDDGKMFALRRVA
jgi:hypothetical protein